MPENKHFPSSEVPEAQPDSARDVFELIMSSQLSEESSEDCLAVLAESRDNAEDTLYSFPSRQEPRSVNRTPTEHLEMITWERDRLDAA